MNKLTKGGLSVLALGTIAAGAGVIWDLRNKLISDDEDDFVEESNDSTED